MGKFGPNVHLTNSTYLNGILARLCSPKSVQPEVNVLVETLYTHLLASVMDREFPKEKVIEKTRMEKDLSYERIQRSQKVVIVNIARAGTYPSHICFNSLHYAIDPQMLRQDHLFASRSIDSDQKVIGTDITAAKIGGEKDDAIVIFPDPMGATGNTLISIIDYYKRSVRGTAKKIIAMNLIVTPEYLEALTSKHPDVIIYAVRLDQGLDEKGYIIPGGGGFGEIMNNSYV